MNRLAFASAWGLLACGYQPLYATGSGLAYHVHLARSTIASVVAAEEVVRGARDALAQEGALAAGDGYPRVEVEVLRVDETSEGVVQSTASPVPVPRARATDLAVVARAFVIDHPAATPALDTGDVRGEAVVGAPLGDAVREVGTREDAVRAVARALGRRLALRVLGHPTVLRRDVAPSADTSTLGAP